MSPGRAGAEHRSRGPTAPLPGTAPPNFSIQNRPSSSASAFFFFSSPSPAVDSSLAVSNDANCPAPCTAALQHTQTYICHTMSGRGGRGGGGGRGGRGGRGGARGGGGRAPPGIPGWDPETNMLVNDQPLDTYPVRRYGSTRVVACTPSP